MTSRRSILTLAFAMAVLAAPALAQSSKLSNPAALTEQAPASYKARFDTSKGAFVIQVNRAWAPHGADRFYNLVKNGFYDNVRFFRVISGFMVQFGIHGDPAVMAHWRRRADPGRPGDAKQQARHDHLCDRRPQHAHHAGIH